LKLQVTVVAGNMHFTGSSWTDQGTALLVSFTNLVDCSFAVASGQVGFRFVRQSTTDAYLDFAVICCS
jgi:hypothetical protein